MNGIGLKRLFYILIFALSLEGADIEVVSDSFYANENSLYTIFSGNVKVSDKSQKIDSDKLTVYFSKNRKPIRFEAEGNIKANIKTNEGREFEATAQTMILYPNEERVELLGSAVVSEINSTNKISGEKIEFNKKSGEARVFGGDGKPAKFIIRVEESK